MSNVEFLLDPEKICRKSVDIELCGQPYDPVRLSEIRQRIKKFLASGLTSTLIVRGDDAWFRNFKDFNGLYGFKMTPISAEVELGSILDIDIPAWCNKDVINYYDLFDKPTFPVDRIIEDVDAKIISLISNNLISATTYEEFFIAVKQFNKKISPLLNSNFFVSYLKSILQKNFSESYQKVIFNILQSDNCSGLLADLFQQVYLNKLRKISSVCGVSIPLPPRTLELLFIEKISLSKIWWNDIKVEPYLSKLTVHVIEKIKNKSLSSDKLALIVFIYSKEQIDILFKEINENAFLATKELLAAIDALNLPDIKRLRDAVEIHIEGPEPENFNIGWKANEVSVWATDYLKYAKTLFNRDEEPDLNIARGFEEWIFTQPLRRHSQNYSWKSVSQQVRHILEGEKCVVLIIVDALGSVIADDLILSVGKNLGNNVAIECSNLFAPIPTLTEVGKIAVATGIESYKLPGGHEEALWQSYNDILKNRNELQVIKSWDGGSQHIAPDTKLLVFFENQLDDMLHECITYSALQSQLNLVNNHILNFLSYLFDKNSTFYQKYEVIITADHGLTRMTQISSDASMKNLGKVGDRFIKANKKSDCPNSFWPITPEGAGENDFYFTAKDRKRLIPGPRPFVHGGLTPEEVIIPFIRITAKEPDSEKLAFQLIKGPAKVTLTSTGWLLDLVLKINDNGLKFIMIEAEQPFKSNKIKFTNLHPNSNQEFEISFSSDIEQSGPTKLAFVTKHHSEGNTQLDESIYVFDLDLPEHNLIIDQGSQDFDDMFN